ncbi:hypothetical protein JCM8202v2_003978 [Rhodotorula sphaerocarpa]
MPLDASLYSLVVRPRTGFPGWLEFAVTSANGTEPGEPSYAVHRTNGGHDLYDPLTEVRLGTSAVAPPSLPNAKPNPKHRLTRLFDPDVDVHLWNHGGLSWSWKMEWEEVSYVWTREVASLLSSERSYTLSDRKPDPSFPVMQYHPSRKGGTVEILDHNLASWGECVWLTM